MKSKKVYIVISVLIILFIVSIYLVNLQKRKLNSSNPFPLSTSTYNGVTYEGSYKRYDAVVEKAANLKNPDICDEINFGQNHDDYTTSVEESRYFCRADYAVKATDIEYCKTLDSKVRFTGAIVQKDKCLRDLAEKLNDKSLCEFLTNKIYCPIK